MLKAAAIIAVGMIIACMEVPALVKNRFVKEAWAFSLLLRPGSRSVSSKCCMCRFRVLAK
ncbi:hypothetical protein EDM54_14170 [Brevibacillus borstelensis]|nr:hypothetical protein EDM54_14170 [Brevibacillus borstelensis]